MRTRTPSRSTILPDGIGSPITAVTRAVVLVGDPRQQRDEFAERFAEARLHLAAEPLDATFVEEVLEAGPLAILAVAEVALHRDDRLGDVDDTVRPHPPERRRQAGIGVVGAGVALAEPSADEHVVARDFSAFQT